MLASENYPKKMLDGWYCRSMANMQANEEASSSILGFKKKLKYLIYENECFQDALRVQPKKYEKPDSSTSESEDTESSDDTSCTNIDTVKRKKMEANASQPALSTPSSMNKGLNSNIKRKRAVVPKKPTNANHPQGSTNSMAKASPALGFGLTASDGHMTPEEVERHLQSRQTYLKLLPERAPPTVPTEMFSNDPSLDSESNDVLENSPNVEEWFD
ncbi:unnamed protein product [Colias eurytheme]|nr:unnamed protein product [Colias eurytheme]